MMSSQAGGLSKPASCPSGLAFDSLRWFIPAYRCASQDGGRVESTPPVVPGACQAWLSLVPPPLASLGAVGGEPRASVC